MIPQTKENRRHPRFVVDVEVAVALGDARPITARTRDISRNGVCLISSTSVRPGEVANLDLVLAFGENAFSEPLRLQARVVWCTAIGGAYQVGAMFVGLDEEQGGYLDMFLQFLDGTLAPRGVGATSETVGNDEDGGDAEEEEDDPLPLSPDEKDDPFRN